MEKEEKEENHKCIFHTNMSWDCPLTYSMKDAGIFDGDLCVVDKAEEMEHGNIVAAYVNGGFTVKYLDTSTRDQGYIRLVPANKEFKPFIIDSSDEFTVWGKVIFTIRDWRNSHCLPL